MKKYKNVYSVCAVITFAFFALFTARLADWQLINGEKYRAIAATAEAEVEKSEAVRGQILDRNGKGLVVNQTSYRVVIDKKELNSVDLKATTDNLEQIFDGENVGFNKSFSLDTGDENAVVFADNIKKDSVGRIAENIQNLNGVSLQSYLVRKAEYPKLAPHILGALGAVGEDDYNSGEYGLNDQIGKFGIEAEYERDLRGTGGIKRIFRSSEGEVEEVSQSAVRGNNVWLTLDYKLQKTAAESLEANVRAAKAEGKQYFGSGNGEDCESGAVVMLSVSDFSILAAASYPSFDLNQYSLYGDYYSKLIGDENSPLFDRVFDGAFACGSVFKPCVALAALENNVIDKSTEFYCAKYYDYYPSNVVECMHYHGSQNIYSATAHSCNWFFAETGRRLGIQKIDSCAEKLGLGVKTGIEFGEAEGILAGRDSVDWQAGNTVQAAIGQSDNAFTPVQLATYTAALANNGTRLKTHLVSKITDSGNSKILQDFRKPQTAEKSAFSEENLKIVQNAMRGVAENPEGTAYPLFGDYKVDIAAKTGTAENAGSDHAVFICYAPYEKPEVAIAVVIENGVRGRYAMQVAKDLLDSYFN